MNSRAHCSCEHINNRLCSVRVPQNYLRHRGFRFCILPTSHLYWLCSHICLSALNFLQPSEVNEWIQKKWNEGQTMISLSMSAKATGLVKKKKSGKKIDVSAQRGALGVLWVLCNPLTLLSFLYFFTDCFWLVQRTLSKRRDCSLSKRGEVKQ